MGLGKGIGPVTISIFLRDMQEVWPKAKPAPTPRVKETALLLGIKDIVAYEKKHRIGPVEFETALHRYARFQKDLK
jgi:hypothetical protein